MIRYAFGAALFLVVGGAACGRFGADEDDAASGLDGGLTDGAVSTADAAASDAPIIIEHDASGLPPCSASGRSKDTFEGSTTIDQRGWEIVKQGADLDIEQDGTTNHFFTVDLAAGMSVKRGYLKYRHDPTPCAALWTYKLAVAFRVGPGDFKRMAGPRLGGFHPAGDAGADNYRNHVAIGFAVDKKKIELSLTDDACDQLPPGRCTLLDTVVAGGGSVDGDKIVTAPPLTAKDLTDGWHYFEMTIEPDASPTLATGYGKIHTRVDTDERDFKLPFPLQEMRLESEVGVSYSTADGTLVLDDALVELVPR